MVSDLNYLNSFANSYSRPEVLNLMQDDFASSRSGAGGVKASTNVNWLSKICGPLNITDTIQVKKEC